MPTSRGGGKWKLLCITHPGLEEFGMQEVKSLCPKGISTSSEPGIIEVSLPAVADIIKICYGSHLFERIALQLAKEELGDFSQNWLEVLHRLVEKADLASWLSGKTFRVMCVKGNVLSAQPDDWPLQQELAGEAGAAILAQCPDAKVKLVESDVVVQLVILKEEISLSLDLIGFDLGKRDYRVFEHSRSVKATVAAAAFALAEWKTGKTLVDPHGRGGILIIEAALTVLKKPVHIFQKDKFLIARLPSPFSRAKVVKVMESLDTTSSAPKGITLYYQDSSQRYVAAAKKNAKIAGIDKALKFSRTEMSWLDLRFEKREVDIIFTQAPTPGKSNSRKEVEDMLTELFYQAEYVLGKKGAIVIICADGIIAQNGAKKHHFILDKELSIYQGMLPLTLQRWIRNPKVQTKKGKS